MRLLSGLFAFHTQVGPSKFPSLATRPLTSLRLFPSESVLLSGIDAWSVNGATLNSPDVASYLFAVSLFPYLALLFFLSRPETRTPSLAFFGFCFLLVFVGATIPAGIYAKYEYHDILANVDWLHGIAESLLTITNLLIITGFWNELGPRSISNEQSSVPDSREYQLKDATALVPMLFLLTSLFNAHPEPSNALSLPTWAVHTSSLIEWLVAMRMIWDYSVITKNPRWKGLAIAMIPSHASGVCACVYHFFFNNLSLTWIVNLQAFLTTIGNSSMAFAAWRVFDYAKEKQASSADTTLASSTTTPAAESLEFSNASSSTTSMEASKGTASVPPSVLPQLTTSGNWLPNTDAEFAVQLIVKTIATAMLVKYGELFLDFPFTDNAYAAGAMILTPVVVNVVKWGARSQGLKTAEQIF